MPCRGWGYWERKPGTGVGATVLARFVIQTRSDCRHFRATTPGFVYPPGGPRTTRVRTSLVYPAPVGTMPRNGPGRAIVRNWGTPSIKYPIKYVAQDVRSWERHILPITQHPGPPSHQHITGRMIGRRNWFPLASPPPGYPSGGPAIHIPSVCCTYLT